MCACIAAAAKKRTTCCALDGAQVDAGVLLAPFLDTGYSLDDPASLRRANDHLARVVRGHADRLIGLAVARRASRGAR